MAMALSPIISSPRFKSCGADAGTSIFNWRLRAQSHEPRRTAAGGLPLQQRCSALLLDRWPWHRQDGVRGACRKSGSGHGRAGLAPVAHVEARRKNGRPGVKSITIAKLLVSNDLVAIAESIGEYALWVVCEMGMVQRGEWEQTCNMRAEAGNPRVLIVLGT